MLWLQCGNSPSMNLLLRQLYSSFATATVQGTDYRDSEKRAHVAREFEERRRKKISAKSTDRKMECRRKHRNTGYVSGERRRVSTLKSQSVVRNFHSPIVRTNAPKWHSPAFAIGLTLKSVYSKDVPRNPKRNQGVTQKRNRN